MMKLIKGLENEMEDYKRSEIVKSYISSLCNESKLKRSNVFFLITIGILIPLQFYMFSGTYSENSSIIKAVMLFVWAVFAFVARPKVFAKILLNKKYLLLFIFLLCLLVFSAISVPFTEIHKKMLTYLVILSPIYVNDYYFKETNIKVKKLICIIYISLYLYFVFALMFLIFSDPNAARILAWGDNKYSNLFVGGGYPLIYSLCFSVICLWHLRKDLYINRRFYIKLAVYLAIAFLIFIISISQYVMALLLLIFGILLVYYHKYVNTVRNKYRFQLSLLFGICFLGILVLLNLSAISDVILKISTYLPGEFSKRLGEISDFLKNTGNVNDITMRLDLSLRSIKTFFNYPIFGCSMETNMIYTIEQNFLGHHNEWFDALGRWGIVGCIAFFPVMYYSYRDNKRRLSKRSGLLYKSVFVIFLILGTINVVNYVLIMQTIFSSVPLFLYINDAKRAEKNINKVKNNILVMLCAEYPFGSGETFLANELGFISGFDCVILYPCFCGKKELYRKPPGEAFETIRPSGAFASGNILAFVLRAITVVFEPLFYSELAGLLRSKRFSKTSLLHLVAFLTKGDYFLRYLEKWIDNNTDIDDNVTVYSYWLYYQAYIAASLKLEKPHVRTISRAHGFDLYEYRNASNYIPLRKYILSTIDTVAAISEDGCRYLSGQFPAYSEKYVISRLGTLDVGLREVRKQTNHIRIATCSNMSPIKRLDRLASSLALVRDFSVDWVNFGDGEQMQAVQNLVCSLPDKQVTVRLLGAVQNQDILKYYLDNDLDVFINVSQSEGVPVAIMEAISTGMPVIATNVGGTAEVVIDGYNGFLLDADFRNEDLVALLQRFADMDSSQYEEMRVHSRSVWEQKYNAEKNYQSFYKVLADGK